ncbi:MAG: ATP-binding protein, partial [Syntrophales bacterium]|nr:ATP-binding protein [Syntrophales bacterium]
MEELSMHILDIADNSTRAGATHIRIIVNESKMRDTLAVTIADNGSGMDEETKMKARDPFFTTKTVRKIGLGIPLIEQAAKAAGGEFSIESEKGKGTCVTATFKLSHIDRQPLGRLVETIITLIAGNPTV